MTSKAVFRCVVCDAAFFNCASLASHSRTHITYACDLCDKVFAQQCRLKQHMRSHNGERPYACNACPKSFSNSSLLRFVDDIKWDKNSSVKDDHCASTRPLQSWFNGGYVMDYDAFCWQILRAFLLKFDRCYGVFVLMGKATRYILWGKPSARFFS